MIYDTGTSEFACNCGSGAQSGGSRGKKPMQNRQRTQKNENPQNHRNVRSPFAARNPPASAVCGTLRAIYVWPRRAEALRYCARTFPAGRREHTVCCRNYVWGRTRSEIHVDGVRPKHPRGCPGVSHPLTRPSEKQNQNRKIMNTRHTPGTWRIDTAQNNTHLTSVFSGAERPFLEREWNVAICTGPQSGANARLIASAPDLLAALVGMMSKYGDKSAFPTCDASISARAAISKAGGVSINSNL